MLEGMSDTVNSLGYVGIFLLVLLAPTPPEVVLPFAGFLAAQGKLSLPYVVVAGVSGSTLSTIPWYLASRYLGQRRLQVLARRHRKWLKLSTEDVKKSKLWFERHGGKALFFSRLIPTVRTLIALPAGFSGMKLLPFLLYIILGETLWQSLLAYAGYTLGRRYELVAWYSAPFVKILVVVFLVAFVVWFVRRKH
jgi:membrane protein DedA with SNARE-associated domain